MVLTENAGKDATRPFHQLGHSQEAKKLVSKMSIGSVGSQIIERQKYTANLCGSKTIIAIGCLVALVSVSIALKFLLKH